jgi:hypothetical protein
MCSPQGSPLARPHEILPIASEFIVHTLHYKWELFILPRIMLAARALSGKTRNPNESRTRDLTTPTGRGCLGRPGALVEKRPQLNMISGICDGKCQSLGGNHRKKRLQPSANVVRTQYSVRVKRPKPDGLPSTPTISLGREYINRIWCPTSAAFLSSVPSFRHVLCFSVRPRRGKA